MYCPIPFSPSTSSSALYQEVTEIEILTQKVYAAEKKIDEYARLIASLYAELKRYQDNICYSCKETIFRASLTSTTPSDYPELIAADSIIISEARSTLVTSSDPKSTSALSLGPHNQISGSIHVARVDLPDDQRHGSHNSSSSRPGNPQTSLSTPPVSPSSETDSEQPQPAFLANSENPTNTDWSVEYNPELKQTLSFHVAETFTFTARVFCTKFSHDGKYLAVGLQNGETHFYDLTTGSKSILVERSATCIYSASANAAWSEIWCLQYSPDNKYIVIGDHKGKINIWEIARRRLRASFRHTGLVRSLDFSPDGRFLASASYDDSVCIWRIRDGSRKRWWRGTSAYHSVTFSSDGRYVAAGNYPGFLSIWDVRTGWQVVNCEIGADAIVALRSLVFMPDLKGIAIGGNTLQCWDISSLRKISSSRTMDSTIIELNRIWEFKGNRDIVSAVSLSFDKRWIIAGSMDHNVFFLDARNGAWVCTLKGHVQRVWAADFSPAGHHLVSGGQDGLLRLWSYTVYEKY